MRPRGGQGAAQVLPAPLREKVRPSGRSRWRPRHRRRVAGSPRATRALAKPCDVEEALSEPAKMVWMDNEDLTIPTVPGAPGVARATQTYPTWATVPAPAQSSQTLAAPPPAAGERPEQAFGAPRQRAAGWHPQAAGQRGRRDHGGGGQVLGRDQGRDHPAPESQAPDHVGHRAGVGGRLLPVLGLDLRRRLRVADLRPRDGPRDPAAPRGHQGQRADVHPLHGSGHQRPLAGRQRRRRGPRGAGRTGIWERSERPSAWPSARPPTATCCGPSPTWASC